MALTIEAWPRPRTGMIVGMPVGVRVHDPALGISVALECSRQQYRNRDTALALFRVLADLHRGNNNRRPQQ
jgi:hypothetical protein